MLNICKHKYEKFNKVKVKGGKNFQTGMERKYIKIYKTLRASSEVQQCK